jgi:hypothetical protein
MLDIRSNGQPTAQKPSRGLRGHKGRIRKEYPPGEELASFAGTNVREPPVRSQRGAFWRTRLAA